MQLDIKIIKVGYLKTNCYVVSDNKSCLIIDPGDEFDKIDNQIINIPIAILITHNHFDHIGALSKLKEKYNIPVYDYNNLKEGKLNIGDFNLEVIYSPGHTNDSIIYYFKDSNRFAKKGKGVSYKFSLGEDLFSDEDLKNEIMILGSKYGIEFKTMPLIYSKDKRQELSYESMGLSQKQIKSIKSKHTTLEEERQKLELQRNEELIQQFIDYGIDCDENGVLNSDDRDNILAIRNLTDEGQIITIFDLSDIEIVELSRLHTQVKTR